MAFWLSDFGSKFMYLGLSPELRRQRFIDPWPVPDLHSFHPRQVVKKGIVLQCIDGVDVLLSW